MSTRMRRPRTTGGVMIKAGRFIVNVTIFLILSASIILAPISSGIAAAPPVTAEPASPISTDPLFASSFKDFNRKMQPLDQYKGKLVVVYFWATWCAPCRAEVPQLIALHEKYKAKDAVVVGIAIDQADKVEKFAKEFGINYPLLVGGNEAIDLSKKLGNRIGGLPFTVIIDRQGNVIAKVLGETPKGKLEGILKPLLG